MVPPLPSAPPNAYLRLQFSGGFYDDDDMIGSFSGASSLRTGGTRRRFDSYFRCYPIAVLDRKELNYGGKIILPPSALEKLSKLHITYPMLFEIHNGKKGKVTHAGVLEFIAAEGRVYLPYWVGGDFPGRLCVWGVGGLLMGTWGR